MYNDKQTGQRKESRAFTREMQEMFAAWVRQLPFLKNDLSENAEQATGQEDSAEHLFTQGR
jgi:hypothetical protein